MMLLFTARSIGSALSLCNVGNAGKISPQLEGTRANVNAFMAKHGIALSKGVSRNSSEDFEAPKGAANAFASGQAGQGMGTSRKAKSRRRKAAKRAAQDATSNGTASSSMSGSSAPSLARVSGRPLFVKLLRDRFFIQFLLAGKTVYVCTLSSSVPLPGVFLDLPCSHMPFGWQI